MSILTENGGLIMADNLTIQSCLTQHKTALAYGNRLILPFHCRMISITVGLGMSTLSPTDILYDFSSSEKELQVVVDDRYTSIYFIGRKNLSEEFGKHTGLVVLECCEMSDDIFDTATHKRLRMRFRDDLPVVTIEAA